MPWGGDKAPRGFASETSLKQLEELAERTKSPLEKNLIEAVVWFYYNKERIPEENPKERSLFLERAIDIQFGVLAMIVSRLQASEGVGKDSLIITP